MVKTSLLYDNFCKTGNFVIYDIIIWVEDGNCKKMARENFIIGAFYNITKNQDNPIKTVGRDSYLSPKTPKNTSFFRGHPAPRGRTAPILAHLRIFILRYTNVLIIIIIIIILGDTTTPWHITYVLVWSKSDQRRLRKTLYKQTNRHYENNGHLAVNQ